MTADLSSRVKTISRDIGFDLVGIARAEPPDETRHLIDWVRRGYAGDMAYLSSQVERRRDLSVAFAWARSVIAVGLQYDAPHPYSTEAPQDRGWISRYAWGDDYHDLMIPMLDRMIERLRAEIGAFEARRYVDTGPVMERAYAVAAGLGAWGKNTCLLHPEHGSWLFLGEVVTDLDLTPDRPRAGMCGRCRACLDACPTQALIAPYWLDARRCISYLTIEAKGTIPPDLRKGLGRHIFGCDICQDVCPWNRKRKMQGPAAFAPRSGLFAPDLEDLTEMDEEGFRVRFRGSPIRRAKRRGWLRNLAVALSNLNFGGNRDRALARLAQDADPLVREHAAYGVGA